MTNLQTIEGPNQFDLETLEFDQRHKHDSWLRVYLADLPSLPEIKARWLLAFLLMWSVVPAFLVSFIWPEWTTFGVLPLPDSVALTFTSVIIGMSLYVCSIHSEGVEERFPMGQVPPKQDMVGYMFLGIPMVAIGFLGLIV